MTGSTNSATGPATREMLQDLHRVVTSALLAGLRVTQPQDKAPSAELIAVARKLLHQEGITAADMGDPERRSLAKLYRALIRQLQTAIAKPDAPAAVLSEVRSFLYQNGAFKDLGAALDTKAALDALDATSLPFQTH